MLLQQLLVKGLTLLLLLPLWPAWAARILLVFPYDLDSQCKLVTPYLEALMQRGHQLTLIHAFTNCGVVNHMHSIQVIDRYNSGLDTFMSISTKWDEVKSIRNYLVKICLNILESQEVQKLMASKVTYDLVVMEPSYTDAMYGLAPHFNASLMGLATCGGDWNLNTLVGYTSSSTFEPIMPIGFKQGITIVDRLYNWMLISEEWLMHILMFVPRLKSVHERYFGHLKQSFSEIRQSFSLILLNQHFSLFEARPNVPSLVEVGGMHVPKQLPALPAHVEKILDEAPHGVIYMALGTEFMSKDLPADILALILNTFATLPQRIIWKFEDTHPPNVSSNIYMDNWLPQQSILAHPNVRMFISNGGILSIIEAVYYAKPVLGLPMLFDQFRNIGRLQAEGAAEEMDMFMLTKHEFESTIKKIVNEPQYRQNALRLSKRFRDQPMHPLDSAVYWTEYVIRYRGAPHMRIPLSNMKIMEYYSLDNLLLIVARLSLLVFLVVYALRKLMYCLELSSFINWSMQT